MDRLACVDLPAFPLQLLLAQRPDWAGAPAAVVDEDKPQGLVLWVNRRARAEGVLPGLRYGPALSLCPGLRAGTVGAEAIEQGIHALLVRLHAFSPAIEPAARAPGVFWLDAGGLEHLYPSSETWALALREDLAAFGFVAAVVVGFGRFGTYAVARALAGRKALVLERPELEAEAARRVPLARLDLAPGVREALAKLGVHRVGELVALPASGIARRFGPEAHRLHRLASGALDWPLSPRRLEVPVSASLALDYRETNAERLVFVVKPLVDELLWTLARQGRALVELVLCLEREDAPERLERIGTAAPTLAVATVMELVRLRLTGAPIGAPVVAVTASCRSVEASADQLAMFEAAPRRDPAAAERAFARLRAAFGGDEVVARARLRDRHTPEGSYAWEPLTALPAAHPLPQPAFSLVRRVSPRPAPLPWVRPPGELIGPYRLAGGWWRRAIARDYYFAELAGGELLWVFYDHERGGWYRQGEIR